MGNNEQAFNYLDSIKINLPESPWFDFYIAQLFYKEENYENAVRHYKKAIEKDDQFLLAYEGLSDLYFNKFDIYQDSLLSHLELAIAKFPKSPVFYTRLASYKLINNLDYYEDLRKAKTNDKKYHEHKIIYDNLMYCKPRYSHNHIVDKEIGFERIAQINEQYFLVKIGENHGVMGMNGKMYLPFDKYNIKYSKKKIIAKNSNKEYIFK